MQKERLRSFCKSKKAHQIIAKRRIPGVLLRVTERKNYINPKINKSICFKCIAQNVEKISHFSYYAIWKTQKYTF